MSRGMVRQASGIPQNANTAALITTIQLTVTNNAIKPLRRSLVRQIYIEENRRTVRNTPAMRTMARKNINRCNIHGASVYDKWIYKAGNCATHV